MSGQVGLPSPNKRHIFLGDAISFTNKRDMFQCISDLISKNGAVNKSTVYLQGSLSTFLKVDSHCLYFSPDSQHTVDIFNLRS